MDQISNLIISIKNGQRAEKSSVILPYSNLKFAIAELLVKKGYVGNVSKKGKKARYMEIGLLYQNGAPKITDVKRISKPSRRLYENVKSIRSFRQGTGIRVLSTPKGIMAENDAKKEKVGGEILFSIY